jgi:hypothetical protein
MELARLLNGKKYMWDGAVYADRKNAEEVAQKYRNDKFEVATIVEKGEHFIFTRRLAVEAKS